GEHAGAVVFSEHNEDAGANQQPKEAGFRGQPAASSGVGDTDAVVGAVDVFVRNGYGLVFDLGG
ncbi:MAG: hypothetical protein WAN65_06295, partial [Candidatus Sulfotelmatobacter sp.]